MQSRKTHKKGPAAMSGGASVSKAGRWGRGAEGARQKINPAAVPRFRNWSRIFFAGHRKRWGRIPHGCGDEAGGRKPINAKAETVARLPTFRDAYGRRRCIVPVDGFFEWHSKEGGRSRRPYAVAMRDGSPFGIGGLWENWKSPVTGQWVRTFCIITTPANVMVSRIHDRMPLILARADLDRWLGPEQNSAELLRSYPSADMKMWPISTRVNSPDNDDPSILEPAAEKAGA